MIQTFIKKLKARIEENRTYVVQTLSETRHVEQHRREAMVERNLALREVLAWIDELYQVGEDELDDEEEALALAEKPQPQPKRRPARRPAGRWGDDR